jgi:hypothetical protein
VPSGSLGSDRHARRLAIAFSQMAQHVGISHCCLAGPTNSERRGFSILVPPILQPLSSEEIAAGREYVADSRFYDWAIQGRLDDAGPAGYKSFLAEAHPKLVALCSATQKYELSADVKLYSGKANGLVFIGAFGENSPDKFVGLTLRYVGFISTSADRAKAEDFIRPFDARSPILMEFHLKPGFRFLPMRELGIDTVDEFEFLLPPNVRFKIADGSKISIGSVHPVVHLILVAQATNVPKKALA